MSDESGPVEPVEDEPKEAEAGEPDDHSGPSEPGESSDSPNEQSPEEHVEPAEHGGPVESGEQSGPVEPGESDDPDLPEPARMVRSRLLRKLRNIAISAVVLFILLLGAGAAYIKFEGGGNTSSAPVSQTQTPSEVVQPPKISPKAAEGVAVSSISSTVAHGAQASVTVSTNAGSKCSIALAHGQATMTAPSLKPQTADAYGVAGWTWTVNQTAPAGVWKANVTCVYHKRAGVVIGSFKVT